MDKQVLVTVGTTKFEDLIINLDKPKFYQLLDSFGFSNLVIQIGQGEHIPSAFTSLQLKKLKVEVVKLIPNFENVIKQSDFVITHCGAGSLLESLKNKKKVIGIINEKLMDNHQIELASQLKEDGYIGLVTKVENVISEFENILASKQAFNTYPDFDYDAIPNLIYKMLDI